MARYISSKYNYIHRNEDGDEIVFNTYTQKLLKVRQSDEKHFLRVLEEGTCDYEKYKILIDYGILVEETFDEAKYLQMLYNEMVYSTDTLYIKLMPTIDCNFKCTYCFERHESIRFSEETVAKVIAFLKKQIPQCKQFRISLFGGEPLLCYNEIIEICKAATELCKKNKIPMYGEMSTNGYLLTSDKVRTLLKYHITNYQVCVDGTEPFHNALRPHRFEQNSYETIIKNLIDIRDNVNSSILSIGLRANVNKYNYSCMKEHIDNMATLFKDSCNFYMCYQCVRDWGGESIDRDQLIIEEQSVYRELYYYSVSKGLKAMYNGAFASIVGNCQACRKNGYCITPDGNLVKCDLAYFDKTYRDISIVGTIAENGSMSIEKGKLAEWIVSKEPSSACKECILFPQCMGGHCAYSRNIIKTVQCAKYSISILDGYIRDMDLQGKIELFKDV